LSGLLGRGGSFGDRTRDRWRGLRGRRLLGNWFLFLHGGLLRNLRLRLRLALIYSDGGFNGGGLCFFLWSAGTSRTGRRRRLISLDEVFGEDALLFGSGAVCVFTVVPVIILHGGDG
jgi:hypothetical protein